ncbi:MAG: PH domain-containing protein [Coprococcus sp.]
MSENKGILWSDRKRILGLPITFTKYELDEERLTIRRGLLTSTVDETLLYRILDIKMSRTLGQKIFGVGTIHLYSADRTDQHLDLESISKPDEVRKQLSRLVEKARMEKRMAGREMYGTADMDIMEDVNDME